MGPLEGSGSAEGIRNDRWRLMGASMKQRKAVTRWRAGASPPWCAWGRVLAQVNLSIRYILGDDAGTPIHALRDPRAPTHGADVGVRDPEGAGVGHGILLERELRPDLSRAPRSLGEWLGAA